MELDTVWAQAEVDEHQLGILKLKGGAFVFHPLTISKSFGLVYVAVVILGASSHPILAAELQVVASIKPVHSLVSGVMGGVGTPHLLMQGYASPHTFAVRPSDAARLENADVVFLVDKALESTLSEPIDSIATKARTVELSKTRGLVLWPFREGGIFVEEMQDDHGHEGEQEGHEGEAHGEAHHEEDLGHDSHDQEEEGEHGHLEGEVHAGADHEEDDPHDHEHGTFDLHIWLDPENARAMARIIAEVLAEADPSNAARYMTNAATLGRRLDDLTAEITGELEPARKMPYIVFHDGYRYFEERFGLTAVGSVVVSPERPPGVRRLRELRTRVHEVGVDCVFDEPQFDRRIVSVIVEGTPTRSGTLDPLGADIKEGPELYFTLIRNMASSFRDCLAGRG